MKHLLATTLLSLVCFAANAESQKNISVICNGIQSDSLQGREPITTTYFFKFEKNPENKNVMEWSMQKNGARKEFQNKVSDSPLFTRFSILVSDHSVLINSDFKNAHVAYTQESKINRLSGDWQIQQNEFKKVNGNMEFTKTINTTGKCEAGSPKF